MTNDLLTADSSAIILIDHQQPQMLNGMQSADQIQEVLPYQSWKDEKF